MNEVICPSCGGVIEYDYCANTCVEEDSVYRRYVGYCTECETNYEWTERYDFVCNQDLKTVD